MDLYSSNGWFVADFRNFLVSSARICSFIGVPKYCDLEVIGDNLQSHDHTLYYVDHTLYYVLPKFYLSAKYQIEYLNSR